MSSIASFRHNICSLAALQQLAVVGFLCLVIRVVDQVDGFARVVLQIVQFLRIGGFRIIIVFKGNSKNLGTSPDLRFPALPALLEPRNSPAIPSAPAPWQDQKTSAPGST